jgi:hypothetical protein
MDSITEKFTLLCAILPSWCLCKQQRHMGIAGSNGQV